MTDHDFQDLRDVVIGAAMIGIMGPLLTLGWWNGTSRKPASPALVKGIWIFFGALAGLLLAFVLVVNLFHLRA